MAEIGKRAVAPLEERWSREDRDPKWSRYEARIESFLHDARLVGVDVVSVNCRATLCRYELVVDDREAVKKMLDLAEEEQAFEGAQGIPVLDGDRFTMYLAPPGESFLRASIPEALVQRAEKTFGVRFRKQESP